MSLRLLKYFLKLNSLSKLHRESTK